jgi:hypothetical protein
MRKISEKEVQRGIFYRTDSVWRREQHAVPSNLSTESRERAKTLIFILNVSSFQIFYLQLVFLQNISRISERCKSPKFLLKGSGSNTYILQSISIRC